MHNPFSLRIVVLVGFLAVLLPFISRLISSPFILLIISPLLLVTLAIAYLLLNLYLAWFLDNRRAPPPNYLQRAARPFAFSTPAAWQAVLTRSQWSQNTQKALPPLYPDSKEVSDALNEIISMIIRDFVNSWYQSISSSPSFPIAVSSIIHASLRELQHRAESIDVASLVVKRILPKVTAHIDQFRQSEVALRGAGLERSLTQSEELDLLLAGRYASKGVKLHSAVENLSTTFTRQTEEMHIRQLVDKVLPYVLPPKEANSKALKIVVREIATCSVLFPIMEMVADPDFWNRTIDQVAGAAIHQQQLISKVRNVLEAQLPRHQSKAATTAPVAAGYTEKITIRTNARQFESFLRSISNTSSLLDARRLKNDIVGEIRRTRVLLDDWIDGEKTEDVVAFLDRLYTAKRKVEERIVVLGGGDDHMRQATIQETTTKSSVTLRDILRNPDSLSYFMEFMDRRHRSLPVQFWLTVESFKNPLESVDSDTSGEEEEIIQDPSTAITVKEDISMINDLYFLDGKSQKALSAISNKHVDAIRQFVSDPDPSVTAQRKVRRSVLLAQRQVERDMESDFEEFERSELWFRAIADGGFANNKASSDPFAKESEPIKDPPPVEQLPVPSSASKHSFSTAQQPQTTHHPLLGMQRTVSSTSNRSMQSKMSISHVPSNIEVLMSPVTDKSTEPSRAPLFDDPEDEMQRAEEKRMEAIHAALTDIMAFEQEHSNRPSMAERNSEPLFKSLRAAERAKRPTVFGTIVPAQEPEPEPEQEQEEAEEAEHEHEPGSFQLAAPGDLQLSYEISRLGENISNLEAQEAMLDTLIKKAELTGDTQELRLLTKSKNSMNRELRELQFQKQQYEQQESANRLISDRTRVSIVNSTAGEEDGKQVVRFLVEVQQLALDGTFSSGWVVARRYNEFHVMHNKLKERYVLVKNLDFPGKRLVASLSGSFLDTRRAALEKYLQSLIAIPIICESQELRAFLSRDSPFMTSAPMVNQRETAPVKPHGPFSGKDLVRNVYRSVAESIDDMFFGPSMLDVMIQRLTRQAAEFTGIVGSGVTDEDLVAQALNASGKAASEATLMRLSGDLKPLDGETSTSTFSAPICDLILAVFELHKKNNWLRRQAIVIILQQVLGGTIERKIRETVKGLFSETRLMSYINLLRDNLWPGGKLRPPGAPRTTEEKIRTRDEANRKLSSLVPDLAANMIGRSNARRGARRIFAVLQNRRLNQHIAYTIMDELFAALFPETVSTGNA
ncbi:PhoX domain-containing protein [Agrocybe pediades]|nr:PhoX domain-containing protein [Agrocybe pediades]